MSDRGPYLTASRLSDIEAQLSERDRAILETLERLRVANTRQLARVHFADLTESSAARQAPQTLRRLEKLGVVARLQHQVGGVRSGSAAAVWALDRAGQKLTSTCGPAGGRRCRRPWTPSVAFLAHRLDVSECYVALVETCRPKGRKLLDFDAEPHCWRRFISPYGGTQILKPDAFVRVAAGTFERGSFLEVDRDTESPATVRRKLAAYRSYWQSGREQERRDYFPRVVWSVPSEARKEVLVGLCAAQPEEAWPLFRVVLAPDLTEALIGEGEA